jgi:hypothetical protein
MLKLFKEETISQPPQPAQDILDDKEPLHRTPLAFVSQAHRAGITRTGDAAEVKAWAQDVHREWWLQIFA